MIILTINRQTNQLLSSPDIVTRGFIHIKDNEELMSLLRNELKRAVAQRFNRIALDRFKAELKDHTTHFLYNQTQRSPIIIPVINIVSERKSNQATQKSTLAKNHQKQLVNLRNSIRKTQPKLSKP